MKPFDTKGEYTPEEVKAALAGVNGTRQLSFRYERLDQNNAFIENIDYVQACSIENNSLADIKRTAKFDILDIGRMNYLQDRIKPYIRLEMPPEVGYSGYLGNLSPKIWWKMDEPFRPAPVNTGTTVYGDSTNAATRETAWQLVVDPTRTQTFKGAVHLNDSALRPELWIRLQVTTSDALTFTFKAGSANLEDVKLRLYYSSTIDGALDILTTYDYLNGPSSTYVESVAVPRLGYYYVQFIPTATAIANPSVQVYSGSRIEDSSRNGIVGVYESSTVLGDPSLLPIGGSSVGGSQPSGGTGTVDVQFGGPLTSNVWAEFNTSGWLEYDIHFVFDNLELDVYMNTNSDEGFTDCRLVLNDRKGLPYYDVSQLFPFDLRSGMHMITTVVDVVAGTAKLYCDGILSGAWPVDGTDGYQIKDFGEMAVKNLTETRFSSYSDGDSRLDDMSVYNKALSTTEISNLYTLGSIATIQRSGYVEWPQGVFVLSSPSRSYVDGTYIHREVEGYDQLVTLKEDSFDYRYSIPAGTKYTDAIQSLATSRTVLESIDMLDPLWVAEGDNKIISATRIAMSNTNKTGYTRSSILTKEDAFTVADIDFSAKYLDPEADNDNTLMRIEKPDYSYYVQIGVNHVDNKIYFEAYAGNVNTSSVSIPYVQATHQWWRMAESKGTITFYTSANGTTWTARSSIPSPFLVNETIRTAFALWPGTATGGTQTASYTDIKLIATRVAKNEIVRASTVLPTTMEWEIGTSKLAIINDLLAAINYESATYDEDGRFVARPYTSPDNRTSEFIYATDEDSVVMGDIDQTVDLFKIPNKWIVVVSDPDRPPLVGTYINDNPMSPTSTVARGRTIVDYRSEQAAPDQVTLDAMAARLAFEASQVYEVIEFETGIMPIHQSADVFTVDIDGMAINDKYAEHKWSMNLENGGSMQHTVRKIVSL